MSEYDKYNILSMIYNNFILLSCILILVASYAILYEVTVPLSWNACYHNAEFPKNAFWIHFWSILNII